MMIKPACIFYGRTGSAEAGSPLRLFFFFCFVVCHLTVSLSDWQGRAGQGGQAKRPCPENHILKFGAWIFTLAVSKTET